MKAKQMKIEYSKLSQSELSLFGCSFPLLSDYSMKVSVNNEIVGFVALENNPLVLRISRNDSQEIRKYKDGINKRNTFYLRKIMFSPKYEELLLQSLFLRINKQLPYNYSIWCKPQIWDVNHYIDKIGGFMSPPFNIRRNIVLFSLNI